MILDAKLYDLTQSLWSSIGAAVTAARIEAGDQTDPPPILRLQASYAESPGWFLVQAAEFNPEPVTVDNIRVRGVYASERLVGAILEIMTSARLLDRQHSGRYFLAPQGRAFQDQIEVSRSKFLANLNPITKSKIKRLEKLLSYVVNYSLKSGGPPGLWSLELSHKRTPRQDAPDLVKIFHHVVDISAFRDDAHIAAWRPHLSSGYEWEAFDQICQGYAETADGVYEELSFRGYAVYEYEDALQNLVKRGWLQKTDEVYSLTIEGKHIRAEVESRTDRYFYRPWRNLSTEDIDELRRLIVELNSALESVIT